MKSIIYTIIPILSIVSISSCSKENAIIDENREIVLQVEQSHLDVSVDTKGSTTEVSSMPSTLYWLGTTGTLKSETSKFALTSSTVNTNASGSTITTGKVQAATPINFNWYVSNASITFDAGGSTIAANSSTDIIAGVSSSNSTTPTITLEHIFSRTGTVTFESNKGYSVSNVTCTIVSKGENTGTIGTYNIASKSFTTTTKLSSAVALTSSSDLYLIPGEYTLNVTYTLEDATGVFKKQFSSSTDITLTGGYINNISGTLTKDPAQPISLSVSLTPWKDKTVNANFS